MTKAYIHLNRDGWHGRFAAHAEKITRVTGETLITVKAYDSVAGHDAYIHDLLTRRQLQYVISKTLSRES